MLIPGKLYKSISRIDFYNEIILTSKYKLINVTIFNVDITAAMYIGTKSVWYNSIRRYIKEMIFIYKNKLIAIRSYKKDCFILL